MTRVINYRNDAHLLGSANPELVAASAAERGGSGAVAAYLDGEVWRPIADEDTSRYRLMGVTVYTVYVLT